MNTRLIPPPALSGLHTDTALSRNHSTETGYSTALTPHPHTVPENVSDRRIWFISIFFFQYKRHYFPHNNQDLLCFLNQLK